MASASAHYLSALSRFADFDGRTSRAELWSFVGVHAAIVVVLLAVSVVLGTVLEAGWVAGSLVLALYLAMTFFPLLSAVARRLHDTGRSSFFVVLGLIPVVGLLLLVWLVEAGDPAPNGWGQPPDA